MTDNKCSPGSETATCNCLMCLAEGDNSPHRLRAAAGKRPVAFRVPRLIGDMVSHWFLTESEDEARAMADTNGVEYQGLYVRDGTGPAAQGTGMLRDCLQSIADADDSEPREPDDADWRFRFLEAQRAAQCALDAFAASPLSSTDREGK